MKKSADAWFASLSSKYMLSITSLAVVILAFSRGNTNLDKLLHLIRNDFNESSSIPVAIGIISTLVKQVNTSLMQHRCTQ